MSAFNILRSIGAILSAISLSPSDKDRAAGHALSGTPPATLSIASYGLIKPEGGAITAEALESSIASAASAASAAQSTADSNAPALLYQVRGGAVTITGLDHGAFTNVNASASVVNISGDCPIGTHLRFSLVNNVMVNFLLASASGRGVNGAISMTTGSTNSWLEVIKYGEDLWAILDLNSAEDWAITTGA